MTVNSSLVIRVSTSPVIATTSKFSSSTISPSTAADAKVIVPAELSVSVKSAELSFAPLTYTLILPVVYGEDEVNISDPPAPTVELSLTIVVSNPPPPPPPPER